MKLPTIPTPNEVQKNWAQEAQKEREAEERRAIHQLTQVGKEISKAKKFPVEYSGSLNDIAKKEIERIGWKISNRKLSKSELEFAGPGTMPTYLLNPKAEIPKPNKY